MKAPTKARSTRATKKAERRVDLWRKRVTIAQTAARTDVMKSTLEAVSEWLEG